MNQTNIRLDGTTELFAVEDTIQVMRKQELTIYPRNDYLSSDKFLHVVDGSWRQRIVEWMFGVVDTCSLKRDSVAIATYYIDVCVEKEVISSRQEFQLAAMTALQLAIKLYDSTIMKLDSMVKLGRGLFTEEDVVAMETKMLRAMKWQVHPPTPVCFLRQYLSILPCRISPVARFIITEVTRFVSEISVCIYKLSRYPPSALAFSGVMIAMERIDNRILPYEQRQQILKILSNATNLDPTSLDMQLVVNDLHVSLDKNVSIQDLMRTIEAQCEESIRKTCGDKQLSSKNGCERWSSASRSPRDVRTTRGL